MTRRELESMMKARARLRQARMFYLLTGGKAPRLIVDLITFKVNMLEFYINKGVVDVALERHKSKNG